MSLTHKGATMKRIFLALAFIASLLPVTLKAQSVLPRITPLNYCYGTGLSSATLLSAFTCDNTFAQFQYGYAIICVYTQGIVWKDDGSTPTGTPGSGGNGVSSGQCFPYNGTFEKIQFIQQTSGAVVSAALYK
jgi:hypothetical protein